MPDPRSPLAPGETVLLQVPRDPVAVLALGALVVAWIVLALALREPLLAITAALGAAMVSLAARETWATRYFLTSHRVLREKGDACVGLALEDVVEVRRTWALAGHVVLRARDGSRLRIPQVARARDVQARIEAAVRARRESSS